ncbi:CpaF family protein [Halodesulfovibrio marinisediminis]|uniref:Pilus assembly protein CpaF n=1 Tax=Halodesulfovibrio marinisediminis DSM 17456 TaxID=1121457 RepID=A0A1N6EA82_9BACT|nr:CpaF family protein [Halodesulfovibrio marinisediminis]SIN79906.1 pilus assembly protein CpaF [Halodesulfovibrio marinisediminis DSM 17456]
MTLSNRINKILEKKSAAKKQPLDRLQTADYSKDYSNSYHEIKLQLHDALIEAFDLKALERMPQEVLADQLTRHIQIILSEQFADVPLNALERKLLLKEVKDEILGLGPLEPYLKDPTVNDVLVNSFKQVFVERAGLLELTPSRFKDEEHLRKIIDRIVNRVGRRIDEANPMVDARLEDGSRVNAIIPPLALDGSALSIRKFSVDPLELEDLINFRTLPTEGIPKLLQGLVKARLNVLISGGTGSGKTTLLNVLSRFIPEQERIVTIEDAAELQLKQTHLVRLETRPANIEGKGEVTQRDLVKNTLRMRPDRIIVGEVRGGEALDMLQAMNTGHDGSLTTIHANSPRDALMRLETMVSMSGVLIDVQSIRRFISSAIDVIIQISRLSDGTRKIVSMQEITGMEQETITMQEIFQFKQEGIDKSGKVLGHFKMMGIRPYFLDKLEAHGIEINPEVFGLTIMEERQP